MMTFLIIVLILMMNMLIAMMAKVHACNLPVSPRISPRIS